MKRVIILALLASTVSVFPALSADLGMVEVPEAPAAFIPATDTWTGFYLGVTGGAGFGSNDATLNVDYSPADGDFEPRENVDSIDFTGGLVGLTAGANWQTGSFVLGIEADVSLTNIGGSDDDEEHFPPFINGLSSEYTSFSTVRGRAGFAADSFLVYATAGLAFASITDSYTFEDTGTGFTHSVDDEFGATGLTVGVGAEVAVTDNISVKAEYLYADFGEHTFDIDDVNEGPVFGPGSEAESTIGHQLHVVRGGLNFSF